MSHGSHVDASDEAMLDILIQNDKKPPKEGEWVGSNVTVVVKRFREEVKRADNNAERVSVLQSKLEGMEQTIRIFASKGKL